MLGADQLGLEQRKKPSVASFLGPVFIIYSMYDPPPDPGGAGWRWRVAPTATSGASDNRYVHTSTQYDHMHNEAAWEGRHGLRQGR